MSKNPPGGIVAGMDEVGRGPWAGPLVAAAVIMPLRVALPGLRDSKQLSAAQREILYEKIVSKTIWAIGWANEAEVDHFGLTMATQKAFRRALKMLPVRPDKVLVDGRPGIRLGIPAEFIIRGDSKIRSIMAASVVAKVTRDRWMVQWAKAYKSYGFEAHKGYGTREHQRALRQSGMCPLHRKSYEPLQPYL